MSFDPIDRRFVRLDEGLVHMRRVEPGAPDKVPLLLLHASPGSSRGLEPLMRAFAETGQHPLLLAPDTLGHGDSAPSTDPAPEIATYAEATARLLDAIGIDRVALYGTHTGARIACEFGVLFPDRVEAVIVDGIGEYEGALRDELVARYAPEKAPDDYGTQMMWAFHFVRDQALHFPHYARDPAHRLMSRAVPSAEDLHHAALEVLKGLGTYHHAYRAAFRYATSAGIALMRTSLFFLDARTELPPLREKTRSLAATAFDGHVLEYDGSVASRAAATASILRW